MAKPSKNKKQEQDRQQTTTGVNGRRQAENKGYTGGVKTSQSSSGSSVRSSGSSGSSKTNRIGSTNSTPATKTNVQTGTANTRGRSGQTERGVTRNTVNMAPHNSGTGNITPIERATGRMTPMNALEGAAFVAANRDRTAAGYRSTARGLDDNSAAGQMYRDRAGTIRNLSEYDQALPDYQRRTVMQNKQYYDILDSTIRDVAAQRDLVASWGKDTKEYDDRIAQLQREKNWAHDTAELNRASEGYSGGIAGNEYHNFDLPMQYANIAADSNRAVDTERAAAGNDTLDIDAYKAAGVSRTRWQDDTPELKNDIRTVLSYADKLDSLGFGDDAAELRAYADSRAQGQIIPTWDQRVQNILTSAANRIGGSLSSFGSMAAQATANMTANANRNDRAYQLRSAMDNARERLRQAQAAGDEAGVKKWQGELDRLDTLLYGGQKYDPETWDYSDTYKNRAIHDAQGISPKGHEMLQKAAQQMVEAKRGLGEGGQYAVDTVGMGIENAPMLAMFAANPVLGSAYMAATVTGEMADAFSHDEFGKPNDMSAQEALLRAAPYAAVETVTEALGDSRLLGIINRRGSLGLGGVMARGGLTEGAEEFSAGVLDTALDIAYGDPSVKSKDAMEIVGQWLNDGFQGGLIGAVMGAGGAQIANGINGEAPQLDPNWWKDVYTGHTSSYKDLKDSGNYATNFDYMRFLGEEYQRLKMQGEYVGEPVILPEQSVTPQAEQAPSPAPEPSPAEQTPAPVERQEEPERRVISEDIGTLVEMHRNGELERRDYSQIAGDTQFVSEIEQATGTTSPENPLERRDWVEKQLGRLSAAESAPVENADTSSDAKTVQPDSNPFRIGATVKYGDKEYIIEEHPKQAGGMYKLRSADGRGWLMIPRNILARENMDIINGTQESAGGTVERETEIPAEQREAENVRLLTAGKQSAEQTQTTAQASAPDTEQGKALAETRDATKDGAISDEIAQKWLNSKSADELFEIGERTGTELVNGSEKHRIAEAKKALLSDRGANGNRTTLAEMRQQAQPAQTQEQTTAQAKQTAPAAQAQRVNTTAEQAQTGIDTVRAMAERGFGEAGAKAMTESYDLTQDGMQYALSFARVYNAVMAGNTRAIIGNLTNAQINAAAKAAREDRAATDKKFRGGTRSRNAGAVFGEWENSNLTQGERNAVQKWAQALGVRVEFVDELDSNADINDNLVQIKRGALANGRNTIGFLVGHELTHRLQAVAPEEYQALRRYVQSTADFDYHVEMEMEADPDLTRAEAVDEAVADYIGRLLHEEETLTQFVQTAHKSLKDIILDFFRRIRNALTGKEKENVDRAIRLLEQAEKAGAKNADTLRYERESDAENADDLVNEDMNTPGHVRTNLLHFDEQDGGRDTLKKYLDNRVKDGLMDEEDAKAMLEEIEMIYNVCKDYIKTGDYAVFGAWSEAEIIRDKYGKPVYSVVKANAEYAMNLDMSLVCKKRRALDRVFNEMIKSGMIDNFDLSPQDIATINEVLRENGIETSCALCFVDTKRFNMESTAENFVMIWNTMVNSMVSRANRKKGIAPDYFNFGGNPNVPQANSGITDFDKPSMRYINRIINRTEAPAIREGKFKKNGEPDVTGDVPYKIAKLLKAHPDLRRLVTRSDFFSKESFDAVRREAPEVMSLFNQKKGTGGPKSTETDTPYLNEIIGSRNRTFDREKAYKIGGVRIQSFSDYMPRFVFDYCQIVADLAAKALPAHAYTKEDMFALQFGKTGIKINMSLVPAVVDGGIAPGLDKDGNYAWKDGHSFASTATDVGSAQRGFELACRIQSTEGYDKNCGTIAVGVSAAHIEKMLGDDNIRMIIPYHASGINPIVADISHIKEYADFTGVQSTRNENGKKIEPKDDFLYDEALRNHGGDAKAAARDYLDWCEENGYTPKFKGMVEGKFVDFTTHENYYKMLIDFNSYDASGNPSPQGDVRFEFPKKGDAFGSMEELIGKGLQLDEENQRSIDGIDEVFIRSNIATALQETNKGRKRFEQDARGNDHTKKKQEQSTAAKKKGKTRKSSVEMADLLGEAEDIDANDIDPINEITDRENFDFLVKDFSENGWNGRPVVVYENADGSGRYQAVTGSHRVLAAREADIPVKAIVMPYSEYTAEIAEANSDEERARVAKELFDFGDISESLYRLIAREDELNVLNYGEEPENRKRFSSLNYADIAESYGEISGAAQRALYGDGTMLPNGKVARKSDTDRAARKILKQYSSEQDIDEVSTAMLTILHDMWQGAKGKPVDGLYDRVMMTAGQIAGNARAADADVYREHEEIRKYFRGLTVTIDPNEATDIPDFGAFRKSLFGKVNIRIAKPGDTPGSQVDSAWQEFQQQFGEGMFPDDITAQSDMLYHIRDLLQTAYRNDVKELYTEDEEFESVRQEIAGDIIAALSEISGVSPAKALRDLAKQNDKLAEQAAQTLDAQEQAARAIQDKQAAEDELERVKAQRDKLQEAEDARKAAKAAAAATSREEIEGILAEMQASDAYAGMVREYGAFRKGEKASRSIVVPRQTVDEDRVSRTIRTAMEAEITTDNMLPVLEEMIEDGVFSYEAYSDKAAIMDAEYEIMNAEGGALDFYLDWSRKVQSGMVSKKLTAQGWALYNAAATTGDTKLAVKILSDITYHQRNAAQAVQATRILKQMTPSAQLYGVSKQAEAFNDELDEKYGFAANNRKRRKGVEDAMDDLVRRHNELLDELRKMLDAMENGRDMDAESVIRQVSEIFRTKKKRTPGNMAEAQDMWAPGDWIGSIANDLSRAMYARTLKKTEQPQFVYQTILKDLTAFADSYVSRRPSERKPRTAADRLRDYFDNRAEYARAWRQAQAQFREKYGDDQDAMDAMDAWLNGTISYAGQGTDRVMLAAVAQAALDGDVRLKNLVWRVALGDRAGVENEIYDRLADAIGTAAAANETQLRGAVSRWLSEQALDNPVENTDGRIDRDMRKALKDAGSTMAQIIRSGKGDRNAMGRRVSDKLVQDYGISEEAASAISDKLLDNWNTTLADEAHKALANRFRDRSDRQVIERTISDRLAELGNLGAFSSDEFRQKATNAILKGEYNVSLNEQLVDQFLSAGTQSERDEILKEIYRDFGRQLPATFADKFNAWRYLAMLGNVRTHGRNLFGNAVFMPIVLTKNVVATALEAALPIEHKTKGIASVELLKAAWGDYANARPFILRGGKWNERDGMNEYIEEGRRIFKNPLAEWARRKNGEMLDLEDSWFAQPHYAIALGSYAAANGITAEEIREGTGEKMDAARKYAMQEAAKATYRDTNAFSDFVNNIGRYRGDNKFMTGASYITSGVLPFRKTPANIAARAVEYSPAGAIMAVRDLIDHIRTGNTEPAQVLDRVAASMTGTGIMAAGAYLAAMGILKAAGGDDDDYEKFRKDEGHQEWAIEAGGHSVTIDWLAPECIPLLMGANFMQKYAAGGNKLESVLNAFNSIAEPFLEMSMLSSLQDSLDAVKGWDTGSASSLLTVVANAAVSLLTQVVPTLAGQAERASQDTRMSNWSKTGSTLTVLGHDIETPDILPADWKYVLAKTLAKVPGFDYNQYEYVDVWGNPQEQGGVLTRIVNNFANPAYVRNITEDDVNSYIEALYGSTAEGGVIPKRAEYKITVDGEDVDLNREQYTTYATVRGQNSYNAVQAAIANENFRKLSDEQKVDVIKRLYQYADYLAKLDTLPEQADAIAAKAAGGSSTKWLTRVADAKEAGISTVDYLLLRDLTGGDSCKNLYRTQDDEDGKAGTLIEKSGAYQKMEAMISLGLNDTARQWAAAEMDLGSASGDSPAKIAADLAKWRDAGAKAMTEAEAHQVVMEAAAKETGVTTEVFSAAYDDFKSGTQNMTAETVNGKTVSGSKKKKVVAYIGGMDCPNSVKRYIYLNYTGYAAKDCPW